MCHDCRATEALPDWPWIDLLLDPEDYVIPVVLSVTMEDLTQCGGP